jgi:hypothetical protein
MAIKEFTDRMAYDCIHNCHTDIASINGYIATIEDVPLTIGGNQAGDDVSALSAPTTASTVALEHPFKDNPELEAPDNNGKQRSKRRR